MLVGVFVGVGDTVVGVHMGVGVGMLVIVPGSADVIMMDMHGKCLLCFFLIL